MILFDLAIKHCDFILTSQASRDLFCDLFPMPPLPCIPGPGGAGAQPRGVLVRTRSLGWTRGASSSSNNASPNIPRDIPRENNKCVWCGYKRRCGFIARYILILMVCIILSCGDWQFSCRPNCDGPGLQRPSMARRRQSMVKWLHDLHLTHPLRERPACPWQGKNISHKISFLATSSALSGHVEHAARRQRENT